MTVENIQIDFKGIQSKIEIKRTEKPFTNTPTKPVIKEKKPECQKKHIKRSGK